MKVCTKYLTFNTKEKVEFVNITEKIEKIVSESQIKEGLCLIGAMHITASVFINDEEEGLKKDFKKWLDELVSSDKKYFHNLTGEDNASAHLKRTIMGREVVLPVTAGKLDFGPWEQVFYGEFDGQRPKRVIVKILGE
jgi:secondary thiamine-phosphate synthase enzyme